MRSKFAMPLRNNRDNYQLKSMRMPINFHSFLLQLAITTGCISALAPYAVAQIAKHPVPNRSEPIHLAQTSSEEFNAQGNTLSIDGRYQEALAAYDKAIQLQPEYVDAWLGRGNSLQALMRYQEALAAYDKLIQLGNNFGWIGRSEALYRLQRYQEALASLDKTIQLQPNNDDAYYRQGYILDELKRYDEALLSYNRALSIEPTLNHAHVWHNKGITLAKLKRYKQAVAAYDRAIQLFNNETISSGNIVIFKLYKIAPADSWYARGVSLFALKRYQEAVSSFDKAIALRSDFADAIKARSIAQKWLR
jgi:tetratricopeptide (TPR) repeat protein